MNTTEQITFTKEEFDKFRDFLGLDDNALTWQGRNKNDFESFWNMVFIEGLSLSQISDRLNYLLGRKVSGPLISWFKWLRGSFYFYTFINNKISVKNLSLETNEDIASLSLILRDSFCDLFPGESKEIGSFFHISHITSDKALLTFLNLKDKAQLEVSRNIYEDKLRTKIELTLYSDWKEVNKKIKKDFFNQEFNFKSLKEKASFQNQLIIIRDTLLLIAAGFVLIFLVKYGNELYEKHIIDKISVLESQLNWRGQSLSFKSSQTEPAVIEKSNPVDISNFGEDPFKEASIKSSSDFNVESNVLLTSWDELPKNLDSADDRQSSYEEVITKGYRDVSYGRTKVFRVLMRSSLPSTSNKKIKELLTSYKAEQVDNVEPGKKVPGGNYYNIFIPTENLKEFLAQVVEVDDAILYESNTRANRNPVGMNKVFIWVKSI